jgi:hypothetical protein
MVAMIQRLDASGLFFCTQLSVSIFLALVFKVFRNGFRCHSRSVAELGPSKLSKFWPLRDDSWADRKRVAGWKGFVSLYPTLEARTRAPGGTLLLFP